MKRRHWEVVDATVGPRFTTGQVNAVRPLTTHADLIAAAAPRGQVYDQPLYRLKNDNWCEEGDSHNLDCITEPMLSRGHGTCWANSGDGEPSGELPRYTEIPYDPTITF